MRSEKSFFPQSISSVRRYGTELPARRLGAVWSIASLPRQDRSTSEMPTDLQVRPCKRGNPERRRRLNDFPSGKRLVPRRGLRWSKDWSEPKRQVSRDSKSIDRQIELRTEPIHVARYRPDSSIRSVGAPENGMVYAWRTPSSLAFAIVPSDPPSGRIRPTRPLTASDQAAIDRTGILGRPYNQQPSGIEPTGRQPAIGSHIRKPRDSLPQGELWGLQQLKASNSEKAIAP